MDINKFVDFEKVQTDVTQNLTSQWVDLLALLPNLIGALSILTFGFLISLLMQKFSTALFRRVGLDRVSNKSGVSNVMLDAGFARKPSKLVGRIIFWLVFFIFMVPAAHTLGLLELVALFKSFIAFLPKIISAMVIIIFGMMFAQFLRRSIIERPASIGSNSANTLGNLIYGIMVTVIVLVALEQLDIQTELLHNIITLVVAGIMLALAISVGLGTKQIAHNLLAGIYLRESFTLGNHIEILDTKGKLKEIGTLSTLILVDDEQLVAIPNTKMYELLVKISQ